MITRSRPTASCAFGRLERVISIQLRGNHGLAKHSGSKIETPLEQVNKLYTSTTINGTSYPRDKWSNVPINISNSAASRLHLRPDHPLSITRKLIQSHFSNYTYIDDLPPVVTVKQNFDDLGFPVDHPGRNRTDTYYINRNHVLRTHTSAHQADTFRADKTDAFLLSADVYRRDAIDRSHFPVFHQMEGARLWNRNKEDIATAVKEDLAKMKTRDVPADDPNPPIHPETNPLQHQFHTEAEALAMGAHLKRSLELVVEDIFTRAKALDNPEAPREPIQMRWIEASFPFTSPSYELEVFHNGEWLELLGCGVIKQDLLNNAGVPHKSGWAFGIGLDRIAMLLFGIDDIRVFWSKDPRFKAQFKEGVISRYVPISKHPSAWRDVSFWVGKTAPDTSSQNSIAKILTESSKLTSSDSSAFHENDVMEIVREIAGDLVEDVKLTDQYTTKKGRQSYCYRVTYSSLERTLTGRELETLEKKVKQALQDRLNIEIR